MTQGKITNALKRLAYLCSIAPDKMKLIDQEEFDRKPAPGKWSKKEILGHLIDSAANNHQRFVRIQFEEEPVIYYDQDKWNAASHYDKADSRHLIEFWKIYNLHLAKLAGQIPEDKLERKGALRNGSLHTLAFYIVDYVDHLEHHLMQIIDY